MRKHRPRRWRDYLRFRWQAIGGEHSSKRVRLSEHPTMLIKTYDEIINSRKGQQRKLQIPIGREGFLWLVELFTARATKQRDDFPASHSILNRLPSFIVRLHCA